MSREVREILCSVVASVDLYDSKEEEQSEERRMPMVHPTKGKWSVREDWLDG